MSTPRFPNNHTTAVQPIKQGSELTYSAPALEKGLDILELLASQTDGLTQGAIADRLQRSTTELFRMVSVLHRRGYLNRRSDGSYQLSLRLFELAHQHPPLQRLLSVALPAMQNLAQSIRQSTHLVIHFGQRILVVAQVDSPEPMGFGVRLGANFPFRPDRASSRVLAAFQTADMQQQLISELLAEAGNRGSAKKVRAELASIRNQGIYTASSETMQGVTDLCAPIFDLSNSAVAALTVPYLKQRDVQVSVTTARQALLAATALISAGLGAQST